MIVGAGASGIVLASRLSSFSDVILLEEGHTCRCSKSETATSWPLAGECLKCSTQYSTVGQDQLFGRCISFSQGKGLGGTTNINAMIFAEPELSIFDDCWPDLWNSKKMKVLFDDLRRRCSPTTVHPSSMNMKRVLEASGTVKTHSCVHRSNRFDLLPPNDCRDKLVFDMFRDDDTMLPTLSMLHNMSWATFEARRRNQRDEIKEGKSFFLDIVKRKSREFIGTSGFRKIEVREDKRRSCEFGIIVSKKWQQKGVCSEVFDASLQFAADVLNCQVVVAVTMDSNLTMLSFLKKRKMNFKKVTPDGWMTFEANINDVIVRSDFADEGTYNQNTCSSYLSFMHSEGGRVPEKRSYLEASFGIQTSDICKAWDGDLRRLYTKKGLTVLDRIRANKVVFCDSRAVGVEVFIPGNRTPILIEPTNGGEVIVCAGTFGSPKLLISSGIRSGRIMFDDNNYTDDKRQWKPNGVDRSADPGVVIRGLGENLQDHIGVPIISIGNWWSGGKNLIPEYESSKKVVLPGNFVHGIINLGQDGSIIDGSGNCDGKVFAQLLLVEGSIAAQVLPQLLLPEFRQTGSFSGYIYERCRPSLLSILTRFLRLRLVQYFLSFTFGFLVFLVRTSSVGSLKVLCQRQPDSPDEQFVSINPQYLRSPKDVKVLCNAMATAREILVKATESKVSVERSPLFSREIFPADLFGDRRAPLSMERFIRRFASTYFHFCGTCGMKQRRKTQAPTLRKSFSSSSLIAPYSSCTHFRAEDGVLDEKMRVYGVQGLRVCDASSFPAIPAGPTSTTCMAIALGLAELIEIERTT